MHAIPDIAISERQILLALAASGRVVSLADIGNWRKNGLLPPLSSHGRGPGKGKQHCWHDSTIVARSHLIFDVLKNHRRGETALLALFFAGYPVPLPHLRRAFLHRARQEITLPAEDTARWLQHAARRLGYANRDATAVQMITAMAVNLDAQTLVRAADDGQMMEAQRRLTNVLPMLPKLVGREHTRAPADGIAPALFLVLLALLRAGHGTLLDEIAARIESLDRPRLRPVQASLQVGLRAHLQL